MDDCKDQAHICLLGLNEQEVPKDYNEASDFFGQSPMRGIYNDENMNIKDFNQKVLKCITEIFYKEKFKFISFLPGGFQQCHEFIEQQNY